MVHYQMKKKLFSVLAILVCASSIAMAKVPLNEAVLGGIYPGMPVQEMIQIYGEPLKGEVSYAAGIQVYAQKMHYGDSVYLYAQSNTQSGPFKIVMINITANNGFATPAGIHVGSTREDVIRTYGQPDIRFAPTHPELWYKPGNGLDMVFHIKNGVVTRIGLGWNS